MKMMIRGPGRPSHAELPGCPLPRQIIELCAEAGLSRKAAAALLGVSLRSWGRWESGETAMHPDTWAQLRSLVNGECQVRERPLPAWLLELRLAAGMTQKEAAAAAGISVSTWRCWENGLTALTRQAFARCCTAIVSELEARAAKVRLLMPR